MRRVDPPYPPTGMRKMPPMLGGGLGRMGHDTRDALGGIGTEMLVKHAARNVAAGDLEGGSSPFPCWTPKRKFVQGRAG